MNPLAVAVGLCVVGILGSGLYSGAETGAYRFNRTRHRLRLADDDRRARLVELLTSDMTAFVVVCLIGTNVCNALVSFSTTLGLQGLEVGAPELVSTVLIGPILFILGEVAPKELFRRHADRLVYATAPLLRLSSLVFRPATWLLFVVNAALNLLGLRDEGSGDRLRARERLREAIAAGTEGGTLTSYQATLARNIFALGSRTVRQVMIPLAQVDALEAGTQIEGAREYVRTNYRTRYPVYRNRRANVVGLLTIWDLLFEERPGRTIRNYVHPVLHLRPGTSITEAILGMRRARAKMAVVSEDDAHALGIVTLKDLVEEITGELKDL